MHLVPCYYNVDVRVYGHAAGYVMFTPADAVVTSVDTSLDHIQWTTEVFPL